MGGAAVKDVWVSNCGRMELRLGRWQDVLADVVECDHVITDAPYSERTHKGFRSGGVSAGSIGEQPGVIEYRPLSRRGVAEFVARWAGCSPKWWVIFGDHITAQWWSTFLSPMAYVFAPVPWVRRDAPPRFSGDGPQRSAEWITVARSHNGRGAGSLPGYYLVNRVEGPTNGSQIPGQKNLAGMQRLVRDYTKPGELVVDPFAGMATTLAAAAIEGRRAIGAECDPETFAKAVKRLSAGYTPRLFA